MISQIEGKLVRLENDFAEVQVGQVCYEVMLPGYVISSLADSIGKQVTLCTTQYFEAAPGGGNIIPRLIGFLNRSEREFFRKYTSVKGMGVKKGLKSLTVPIATIASAIEAGDEKMLTALPAIGTRFAAQIVAQLKGKLGDYAFGETAAGEGAKLTGYQTEALEILIAWGEKRNEALELVETASARHPQITTAEELVPLIYRIKQGVEA